jgi:hypothetical protein
MASFGLSDLLRVMRYSEKIAAGYFSSLTEFPTGNFNSAIFDFYQTSKKLMDLNSPFSEVETIK